MSSCLKNKELNHDNNKGVGFFITLEGGEGSGKSVQCAKLCERLTAEFPARLIVRTREPGGAPGAELIRQILLTGDVDRWLPVSELLLFYAARYDHWRRVILPALEKGGIVVCDRFFDSSVVYQGRGLGLPEKFFRALHEMFEDCAQRSFVPDRTYVLDIDPIEGIARSKTRILGDAKKNLAELEDRFERIDIDFHVRVREGYHDILRNEPERCVNIDASQQIDDVHEEIWRDVVKVV
ncbi:MAG: dTMP kinase [Holosporales bacterium]|jgi:dTMP kinase|nr:dTMP kinase [Holosporales bacterium]